MELCGQPGQKYGNAGAMSSAFIGTSCGIQALPIPALMPSVFPAFLDKDAPQLFGDPIGSSAPRGGTALRHAPFPAPRLCQLDPRCVSENKASFDLHFDQLRFSSTTHDQIKALKPRNGSPSYPVESLNRS